MASKESIVKFTCTDRLNETKSLEVDLKIENKNDKKEYNKVLIEKLKDFQVEINSLMTEFVDKEKKAVASNQLSNDHLKILNEKAKNGEEDDSSSEDEASSKKENDTQSEENSELCVKRNQESEPTDKNLSEPAEKKLCVNNA